MVAVAVAMAVLVVVLVVVGVFVGAEMRRRAWASSFLGGEGRGLFSEIR